MSSVGTLPTSHLARDSDGEGAAHHHGGHGRNLLGVFWAEGLDLLSHTLRYVKGLGLGPRDGTQSP